MFSCPPLIFLSLGQGLGLGLVNESVGIACDGQLVAAVVDVIICAESAAVQHGFDAVRRHFFLGAHHEGPRPGLDVSAQNVV